MEDVRREFECGWLHRDNPDDPWCFSIEEPEVCYEKRRGVVYSKVGPSDFEALFSECQLARDTAGFLGSVPDCIRSLDDENKELRDLLRTQDAIIERCAQIADRVMNNNRSSREPAFAVYTVAKEIAANIRAMKGTSVEQTPSAVSVELMQRVWANLYYDEEEAGNTFQWTLDDVVDWLSRNNGLSDIDAAISKAET